MVKIYHNIAKQQVVVDFHRAYLQTLVQDILAKTKEKKKTHSCKTLSHAHAQGRGIN